MLVCKGYDNHHFHNKHPDRKWDWMTSCLEEMVLRIWRFWKRVSWELRLDHRGRELSFLPLWWRLSFSGPDRRRWTEILNITRCAMNRVESDRMVSIVSNCVSLFVPKNRSQKLINSFVPEQRVRLFPPVFVYVFVSVPLLWWDQYVIYNKSNG